MKTAAPALADAFAERATELAEQIGQARIAPALFQPDHVDQLDDDFQTAAAWHRYWSAQARTYFDNTTTTSPEETP